MADGWEDLPAKKDAWEPLTPGGAATVARREGKKYGAADLYGPIDAAASLASGAVAGPLSGLAGIAGSILPGPAGQGADWTARTQDALTYDPRTKLGEEIVSTATAPLEAWAKGADSLGGRVSDVAGPAAGAATNAVIQTLPMGLGKTSQGRINRARVLADTEAEVRAKLGAPKDAVIANAADKGLVISPAEANPSLLNRIAEGFSGQSKVQLMASAANQPTFNNIVRGAFGIAKDTPLSIEVLSDVRKKFGDAYEKVRDLGEIPLDAEYGAALDKIAAKYEGAAKSFPAEASDVQKAVSAARNTATGTSFDASAAVDKMKIERAAGDKAFRAGDTELGKAHKSIADAIESQIGRHLENVNNQGLFTAADVAELRQAREVIAKTYDVQKALKGNNVDVKALANQLKKGKLSGDLKDIATFGQEFPGSAQVPGKNAPVLGDLGDIGMGGLGGVLSGIAGGYSGHASPTLMGGVATAAALSRPGVRAAITSKALNPRLTGNSYEAPLSLRLTDALTSDPALYGAASQLPSVDERRRK